MRRLQTELKTAAWWDSQFSLFFLLLSVQEDLDLYAKCCEVERCGCGESSVLRHGCSLWIRPICYPVNWYRSFTTASFPKDTTPDSRPGHQTCNVFPTYWTGSEVWGACHGGLARAGRIARVLLFWTKTQWQRVCTRPSCFPTPCGTSPTANSFYRGVTVLQGTWSWSACTCSFEDYVENSEQR